MEKIRFSGWDHFNGGLWYSEISIPKNYQQITSGHTENGDKCAVLYDIKKYKNKIEGNRVKSKFETVLPENIGQDVKEFNIVVRKK